MTTALLVLLAPLVLVALATVLAQIRSAQGPCVVRSRHDRLRALRAGPPGRGPTTRATPLARQP